jgi:uncharacterized membrane protein
MIITIHALFGILALCTGAWNLLQVKGTGTHQYVGRVYALSMYALIGTSFFIYEFFGSFGAFHVLSLVSGATLTIALYFPLRRARHSAWREHHYFWITYSYVGLVMATGSHFFSYFSSWPFLIRATMFWAVPYVVGTLWIFKWRQSVLTSVSNPVGDSQ